MEITTMKTISDLAEKALDLEAKIGDLEAEIKDLRAQKTTIEVNLLPELLSEANVSKIETANATITIKKELTCSLRSVDRGRAITWIRENHPGLITNCVAVHFAKGEDAQATRLVDQLRSQGLPVEQSEDVNTTSLKSSLREDLSQGRTVPMETLGASSFVRALIKLKG